ncbi:8449_t:CDS:2 [Acaulospora morrowiae]|uniref:8449_t:CDS:1 n=1 Tax=Acaulospora morrowiae TaxID=94023 RepID=A0A9N8Z8V0_9GLOM|nr:8449_t:CDS:2 [Acaulospora morrowiae]
MSMDELFNDQSDDGTLTNGEDTRVNPNQMLAANYAKLVTMMTTPSGARTRDRTDIRDITCFKCDNKGYYIRDCVMERTNHWNEIPTVWSNLSRQKDWSGIGRMFAKPYR